MHDVKEKEGLDKFKSEGEGKDIGYIPFPFVALPQKESNRLTDMDEKIMSLNHLICIPKIGYSYNSLLCVRVPRQKVFKSQKKILY